MIFGGGDSGRDTRRILRRLGKELAKDRYKLYRPRGGEVQEAFPRLLFAIHKSTHLVAKLIRPGEVTSLGLLVISNNLNDYQRGLRDSLDEGAIRERFRGVADVSGVVEEIKDALISYVGSFDAEMVSHINRQFSDIVSFTSFCHFDYYFTLKKFDSALEEEAFSAKPNFSPIESEYVVDDIKDFIDLAQALPLGADWEALFEVLSQYRSIEMVDRVGWQKVFKTLATILQTEVLSRIVQHASRDPQWKPTPEHHPARIVESYLTEVRSSVEAVLRKIQQERRNNKIDQLVTKIYGTAVVARAKNYTKKGNAIFQRIGIDGYQHVEAFNYLKAYLLDSYKKDVREIVQDLLIVRGKWTTLVQSQQTSEAYHGVLSVSEQIIAIDDDLADEGEWSQRLRRAMGRVVNRDVSTHKGVVTILDELNTAVSRLITGAAQHLIVIGKVLKLLIEDVDRKEYQVITNWKELDAEIEDSLKQRMTDIYRQLYYFIQLLQIYVGGKK